MSDSEDDIDRELDAAREKTQAKANGTSKPGAAKAFWPELDAAAYHGVLGDVVFTFNPHTEADPVAILLQTLVYFGNMIGRSPHYVVESDRHGTNLFAVLVGETAKGRKGTSGGRARAVVKPADGFWADERMKSGLSSGEGVICEVSSKEGVLVDTRLMVTEHEFGSALAVMERAGNTLSPVIRNAWDGMTLQTLTKNLPLRATDPHVSIVGHITIDELRSRIMRTEMANGFANRFLFALVRRSKKLPHGGHLSDHQIERLANVIKATADYAKGAGRIYMTQAASAEWALLYDTLSEDRPGLLGAITARAEAQCIRLAMIYALLDQKSVIEVEHLLAAKAVWDYCDASAAYVFGRAIGDPVADEILRALGSAGAEGMTRTAIRDLFGRNRAGDRIEAALALLGDKGRARMVFKATSGRPSEIWFATGVSA